MLFVWTVYLLMTIPGAVYLTPESPLAVNRPLPSDQESRLLEKDGPHWRSNTDSAIRICAEPESERGPIHFHMLFEAKQHTG